MAEENTVEEAPQNGVQTFAKAVGAVYGPSETLEAVKAAAAQTQDAVTSGYWAWPGGREMHLLEHTITIVASQLAHGSTHPDHVPGLIKAVHAALVEIAGGAPAATTAAAAPAALVPAVPVKKSVTEEHIVCLEDGKTFKSLKRHLATQYGMTPDAYRTKWGLPKDYPMVAPAYAARRSELAKATGLGSTRSKTSPEV